MKAFVVALLVAVGILAGFYGGFKFGQNNVSASAKISNSTSAGLRSGSNFGANGRNLGSACPSPGAPSPPAGTNAVARGSITDLASGSLTITTPNCDVKVVFGNTVQVSKTVPGSSSDLQDNLTVTIIGTRQSDGSIKANVIQIGNQNGTASGQASASGG